MKILESTQITTFESLLRGAVFGIQNERYIKTHDLAGANAVNLTTNTLCTVPLSMTVIPFPNAVLHLNDPA